MALAQALSPTLAPASRASLSPCSKCTPPYWRDSPAWLAAYWKLVHDKVIGCAGTPGWVAVLASTLELPAAMVTLSSKLPRPVKPVSTSAAAMLKVECPEAHSAKGGPGWLGGRYGIQSWPLM